MGRLDNIDSLERYYRKKIKYVNEYRTAQNAATGSKFDANANVENKNITTLAGELSKEDFIGINRLLMCDMITRMFGRELAEEYLRQLNSHEIYKHDETSIYPYCVSITMYPFLFNGMKDIGGKSNAPKHLQSFCGSFINLVFAIASQFAGAVATPEFFTYMDYFIRKEYGDDYYLNLDKVVDLSSNRRTIDKTITEYFQQVTYSLNQPAAARNFQSVFWNVGYFDEPYFKGIFKDFVFPDGTEPIWESVNWLQRRYMKWFNEERLKKELTFPVESMSLLNDGTDFVDQDMFDFTAEMYAEGHSFFTYTSGSVDSLSSCCFDGRQKVKCRDKNGEYCVTFKKLSEMNLDENTLEIYYGGKDNWRKGRLIIQPMKRMYKISVGKRTIYCTEDHLIPSATEEYLNWALQYNEQYSDHVECLHDVAAKDIKVGDYVAVMSKVADAMTVKKVTNISEYESKYKNTYCFEMSNQNSPYFVLANGIMVHNCRLRNEIQENEFSYTLGAGGVATGSKGVMTININRLVQNAVRDGVDISDAIREQVEKVHKYLLAFNEIIKDEFESNLLGIYNAGYISLAKQYLTVGINGFVEGAEFLGIDISPNEEYYEYGEKILKPIYELNKRDKTKDVMFNTEFVPKMSGYKAV